MCAYQIQISDRVQVPPCIGERLEGSSFHCHIYGTSLHSVATWIWLYSASRSLQETNEHRVGYVDI